MSNFYPRESVEFQPIRVTLDGVEVQDNVEFSVVPRDTRPDVFTAPTELAGKIGVLVDGMDPGVYTVWAQVTSAPEVPVLDCGYFTVT